MIALTAPPAPGTMVEAIVFFGAGFVVFAFMHWRLQTGWQMDSGRMKPSPQIRPLMISLMYTAAPGMVVSACLTAIAAIALIVPTSGPNRHYFLIPLLILLAVAAVSGIWAAKEFWRPSDRRIPDWLK